MVPLGSFLRWLSSTAGYVPGNEAQISLSDMAHHQRVLSSGCYPFLSGRSGKRCRLPWQAFQPQRKASITSANRSAFALSQNLAVPFADPLAGLDGRNLRDAESYTEKDLFDQLFVCFIFRRVIYLFGEINLLNVSWVLKKNKRRKKNISPESHRREGGLAPASSFFRRSAGAEPSFLTSRCSSIRGFLC